MSAGREDAERGPAAPGWAPRGKAYGRPVGGGRGTYVSFAVPDRPELTALIVDAADRAGSLWAAHRGPG